MRRFRKTACAGTALVAAVAFLLLTLAGPAPGEEPPVAGGAVPSSLRLSLSEPSPFTRIGPDVFATTIRATVTATVSPTQLSLGGEETSEPLRGWRRPVSHVKARIRLRRGASERRALRGRGELLWVTLTAGGP